jgi:hypothetical protein
MSGSGEFTEVIECHRGAPKPPNPKEDPCSTSSTSA